MPYLSGLAVAEAMAAGPAGVVLLSADPSLLAGPLPAGAIALVKGEVRPRELLEAVRRSAGIRG
jgi:hypothetical protein